MIKRTIAENIKTKLNRGKAIIIVGPRQVGKTTLIKELISHEDFLFFDGDDPATRTLLDTPNTDQIRSLLKNKKIVFIDEAQRINNIGLTAKIIIDQFQDVQLWISGSSSFYIYDEFNESLTGRKWEYKLLPISWEEFEDQVGYLSAEKQLEDRLVYGMYPDVLNNQGEEIQILKDLVNSYLYKDILAYGGVKKPEVLDKLVNALALQVGSEVNYNELSQLVGIDRNTVEKYISILEKGYVIFKLPSFSRNLRNEIKKGKKIYFYDNGVRNAIIGSMNKVQLRTDVGALWENFLVAERIKQIEYKNSLANSYFWRTTQQQEIDYIEEISQELQAFEFKWNPAKKAKISKTFINNYNTNTFFVNRNNFRDFVVMKS
ncbi:ATP-binding protein [Flavobacterium sp. CS20]|uniref:ATP-binding protein n=1 Tax=Flavobacterium sp. CS20 TaxID=2775246 RepID=UPI001B3A394D|nr:ATP-binding protein [Flavobacterium sp. CS20]QTY26035.1 ATP-binding protein [Flavobacterium sp. CS20]